MTANHYMLEKAPAPCRESSWVFGPAIVAEYGGHTESAQPPGAGMVDAYNALGPLRDDTEYSMWLTLEEEARRLELGDYPGIKNRDVHLFASLALEQLDKIDDLWGKSKVRNTDTGVVYDWDYATEQNMPIEQVGLQPEEVEELIELYDNAGQLILCARYGEAISKARQKYSEFGYAEGAGPVQVDPRFRLQRGPQTPRPVIREDIVIQTGDGGVGFDDEEPFFEEEYEEVLPAPVEEDAPIWPWLVGGAAVVAVVGGGIYYFMTREGS